MSDGAAPITAAATDAPVSGDVDNTAAPQEGAQSQTKAPEPEDPEYELEPGRKYKKSELLKTLGSVDEIKKGAYQKFSEAAQMRKEAQALIQGLTKDTKAALKQAGIDPLQWAQQVLTEEIDALQLTPEQKRLKEIEAENAKFKAEREEQQNQQKQAAEAREVQQWQERIANAFGEALKSASLPVDEYTIQRMAVKADAYLAAGILDVPLTDIVAEIKDEDRQRRLSRLQSLQSDEQIEQLYDKSEIEKIRQYILKQAQPKLAPQPQRSQQAPGKGKSQAKPLTYSELARQLQRDL